MLDRVAGQALLAKLDEFATELAVPGRGGGVSRRPTVPGPKVPMTWRRGTGGPDRGPPGRPVRAHLLREAQWGRHQPGGAG